MIKTTQIAKDREFGDEKTVLPAEIARGVHIENAPSLAGLKLMHLLIAKAGGKMADDAYHHVKMADIKRIEGMRKPSRYSLEPLFQELGSTLIVFDDVEAKKVTMGSLIDISEIDYSEEENGALSIAWRFGTQFRKMAEKSCHWAIIDRQTIFSLRSKYSLLLFQHISSFVKMKHMKSKEFKTSEFRKILGIEKGKLKQFTHFRERAIESAISEINSISRLNLRAEYVRSGRSVVKIVIHWEEKDFEEKKAIKRELDGSSVGRSARLNGTAERLIFAHPFPASGGYTYDRFWYDLAKTIWTDAGRTSREFPDTATVASFVRKKADEQGIELDNPKIEGLFKNVVKNWRI